MSQTCEKARWVEKEKTTRVNHKHVSGLNIEDKPSKPGVYMECLHCIIAESHFVLNLKCKAFNFFTRTIKSAQSNCAGKKPRCWAAMRPWMRQLSNVGPGK